MTVNAAKAKIDEPAARPSRPSVRFTALVMARITSTAISTQPTLPISQPGASQRVNEIVVLTLVNASMQHGEADGDEQQADASWPACSGPRLRSRNTVMPSSTNPTTPAPTMATMHEEAPAGVDDAARGRSTDPGR